MIYDISHDGFRADAPTRCAVGDTVKVKIPRSARIDAKVVRVENGVADCAFARPLAPGELAEARANAALIGDSLDIDEPDRWPLPVRAGIAVGGTLALWGLVALALR